MNYDPPYEWCIDISLNNGREIPTLWITADTGQDAIVKAMGEIKLEDGELIHMVHIGAPIIPADR